MNPAPANLILMYHRIADAGPDPWRLCVSPDSFEAQLDYLLDHMEPVALEDIGAPSQHGRPRVAITFDDGYLDNLEQAMPRLASRGLPATFFIMTGTIGSEREFWWDELDNLLLCSETLPRRVEIESGQGAFEHEIGQWRFYGPRERAADAGEDVMNAKPGSRLHSYFEIWDWLCAQSDEERERVLDTLWEWSGRDRATRAGYRPMTREELARAGRSPLVEIGAHTISHPRIPTLSQGEQAREILSSADTLEQIIAERPTSFSFPFGQRDSASVALVRETFERAVLTRPGVVTARTPPHQLNRIAVENQPMESFSDRLDQFLSRASF